MHRILYSKVCCFVTVYCDPANTENAPSEDPVCLLARDEGLHIKGIQPTERRIHTSEHDNAIPELDVLLCCRGASSVLPT